MEKRRKEEVKQIRLDADTATLMLDALGGMVSPALRALVNEHFRTEVEREGEMSLEFLQGFFSGLFFGQNWLLKTGGREHELGLMTQLTLEAARKYLEQIEKSVATGTVEAEFVESRTELGEEQLILITEVLIFFHLEAVLHASSFEMAVACSAEIERMLRETVRKLLRLNLRDPRFREAFNEYFATHPLPKIRQEGWEWLSEILAWES